jgi:hypothetical protein
VNLRTTTVALVTLLAATQTGCSDPTHDQQVQALGGEDPNVPTGPLHRPGQPCLVCHGGSGPASAVFSAAGTVYVDQNDMTPASSATVQIEDVNGSLGKATTNQAGNFYLATGQWQATYPTIPQVTLGSTTQLMQTHIGREGSCGHCHADPSGPFSAGHIYVNPGDGGM